MRVIAGEWRGRRLAALPGQAVRPTTGRVREALFSMLGATVPGAGVADLCCGAGALGIEALSRGAARAIFVDTSPASLAVVRANLAACGAAPERWRLERADALAWLERLGRAPAGDPLLVLADPPYAGELAGRLVTVLLGFAPDRLAGAAVEHDAADAGVPREAPAAAPWRLRQRRYGRTALTLLEEA